MKLRSRMLAGVTVLILLPLLALAFGIRQEMGHRLTAQYSARVDVLIDGVRANLRETDRDLEARLASLRGTLRDDNRMRLFVLEGREDLRPYVLDWAGRAMTLTALDLLQLQDAGGRIVSSGHFRNEYDRTDVRLLAALRGRREPVVVVARRAEGSFRAVARLDSVRLGEQWFYVAAGVEIDRDWLRALSPGTELVVSLTAGEQALSPDAAIETALASVDSGREENLLIRALDLPAANGGPVRLVVTHSLEPRARLLQSLDRWLLGAWLLTAAGAVLLAVRVSARMSRPLEELAEKTRTLDLDRLDTDFRTERKDEVGRLSRFLAEMTGRLRASVARLTDAERRATRGEMARQVNHDLRNALTPLRNVVRHLTEVAEEHPEELATVYGERRETLESGLAYLETLAGNWRRISHRSDRVPCDLTRIAEQVTAGRLRSEGGVVRVSTGGSPELVLADPVGLRRVVENLVANACESLDIDDGVVDVTVTRTGFDDGSPAIRLSVRDSGPGIPPEIRERVFDDFFTTKEAGSGLGLSVVRRLVSDFEGTVRVASAPGRGAEFIVLLPAAGEGRHA